METRAARSVNNHPSSVTSGQVRSVMLLMFIILIGIFSVYSLSFQITPAFAHLHNLQLTAALLSALAAIMALIKYYTRRDPKYLFIGTAFLAAGIVKGIQAIPPPFLLLFPSDRISFLAMPENFGMPRLLLGIFLVGSLLPWFYTRVSASAEMTRNTLYTLFWVFIGVSTMAILLLPLPLLTIAETYTTPLLTFVLGGYLLKGVWKRKYFEYCLVLALLLSIIAGLVYTSSQRTETELFGLAQLFETISYFLVVTGLLISMYIAYKEVEEARENTDAILRSIGDGVFVTDNQGIIVLMNKVAEQFSGVSAKQAIGKHYRQVFVFSYEENPGKPFPHIVESVLAHQPYIEDNTNHPVIRTRYKTTPVLLTVSPVKNNGAKIAGCVVVMVNMSKLREIERSKDNFLSLAAHQLGTPLGAVRWYTQMLLSGDAGKVPVKVADILKQISENNQRMVDLVNALLNVSRIDQKAVSEHPKTVVIESVIAEAVKNLKIHAFKKQVAMTFTPPKQQATRISLDPDLLREVLTNILSNAIKYNKSGGEVAITLSETNSSIVVTIADTGIGIPKNDQDKIYTKFFRASNARTKEPEGTGLGLFVVKSYIEGWGGQVAFSSKENDGTTFTLTIPKKPTHYALSANLAGDDGNTHKKTDPGR